MSPLPGVFLSPLSLHKQRKGAAGGKPGPPLAGGREQRKKPPGCPEGPAGPSGRCGVGFPKVSLPSGALLPTFPAREK